MDTFEQIAEQLYNEGALNVAPAASGAPTASTTRPGAHQAGARAAFDTSAHGSVQPAPQAQQTQQPQQQQPAQAAGITTVATSDPTLVTLMASAAYKNASDPGHRQALADVAARYAELFPEADDAPAADVGELRRSVGVQFSPTVDIPPQYREQWSEVEEGDFLSYAVREALPTATVQSLMDFVIDAHVLGGGQIDDSVEEEFHQKFANQLSQAQRDQLVRWYRSQA